MLSGLRLTQKVAPVSFTLRGIAHPSRLAILYLLLTDSMEVRDIVSRLKLPANLVAHHLSILYKTGWVTKTKQGNRVTYTVKKDALVDIEAFFSRT